MSGVAKPLVLMLVVQVLLTMGQLTIPVLAPAAAHDLGVSPNLVGLYTGLVYLGAMVGALLSGQGIAVLGPLRLSQICLILIALSLCLFVAPLLGLVAASAIVMGLGYGPATPASSEILTKRTSDRHRNLVFSLKQTGVPAGGMLAGALVPSLVLVLGWRMAAITVGVALLVMAVLLLPYRQEFDSDYLLARASAAPPRADILSLLRRNISEPLALVLKDEALRPLVILSFTMASMQLCLAAFLVVYLTGELDYSLTMAGMALAVAQGAGMVARPVWGWLADRAISPARLLLLLAFVNALSAALTAGFDKSWPVGAVLAVLAMFGVAAIAWTGVYLAEVARLAPEGEVGRATGGAFFVTFAGAFVGPPVFGLLHDATGSYRACFLIFAVLAGLVAFYVTVRSRRTA